MIKTTLPKAPTGISGLDEVTGGGLPRGRPTLVCGPAGCGKTLLAMEFLVRGITEFDEPGVFVAFEESADDLVANVASLGFDLARARGRRQARDRPRQRRSRGRWRRAGEWDLEGLFLRLGAAIDSVGRQAGRDRHDRDPVRRVLQHGHPACGAAPPVRLAEGAGVTAVITGERGDGTLTRHGIEEYVSDCVIVLDHRVTEQTSTRRLRILKYRGSLHGTNEYPFLIGESGVSVLPITSLGLQHSASRPSGCPPASPASTRCSATAASTRAARSWSAARPAPASRRWRPSSATPPAPAASGPCTSPSRSPRPRSSATCPRSASTCSAWVDAGLLQFRCFRPSLLGLEAHLFAMQKLVSEFDPAVVVMDPSRTCCASGPTRTSSAMLTRQVDFLKAQGRDGAVHQPERQRRSRRQADQQIASLVDTWLLVKTMEGNGEHNRVLYVLKSRGMAHSNQIREFLLTATASSWPTSTSARRACSPARPARPRRPRSAPTGPRA